MLNPNFEKDEVCHATNGGMPSLAPEPTSIHVANDNASTNGKSRLPLYDPYDYGKGKDATSFWGIVGHLIVIALGPVLLTIPQTFIDTGYLLGLASTIGTVTLYVYCMRMVIATEYELCKRTHQPNISYIQMVRQAFDYGPPQIRFFSRYTEMTVCVVFPCIWLGGNAIHFLLAADNLHNSYVYFFPSSSANFEVVRMCVVVPLILLCWIPNLKLLVPLSTAANLVNAGCICVILWHSVTDLPTLSERKMAGDWTSIPKLVGVQLYSITATVLILPFKNELKDPRTFSSRFGVLTASYMPVGLMYSTFGVLCYIKYGDGCKGSIIQNLPDTPFNKLMIGLYGVATFSFYPLVAYASFEILWNTLLKHKYEKNNYQLLYEYVCRTVCAILPIVFAYTIPNLDLFLSLAGTVGTSIDSLIIPAVAQMLVYYKTPGKDYLYVKNSIIIVLGLFLSVMGVKDCIRQFSKTYFESN